MRRDVRRRIAGSSASSRSLIALAPLVAYPVFLMKVMCFALFASAFNLLLGFGGLLSFGHAAYFGCGSYVTAYAAKAWGWPPELRDPGRHAARRRCSGLVFGVVAIRRQGIYFAMITLALAQLVYFVCLQAPFTGGEDGIQGVPRGRLFGLVDLVERPTRSMSSVGVVFLAGLAADPPDRPFALRPRAAGHPRERGARALAGLSGRPLPPCRLRPVGRAVRARRAPSRPSCSSSPRLTDVHWTMSGEVVLMTLIGGMGTLFGPLVGAARGGRHRILPRLDRLLGRRSSRARSSSSACSASARASRARSGGVTRNLPQRPDPSASDAVLWAGSRTWGDSTMATLVWDSPPR